MNIKAVQFVFMCHSVHVQEEPMGGGVLHGDQNMAVVVDVKSPPYSLALCSQHGKL